MKKIISINVFLLVLVSCNERFIPELEKFEEIIVIEGVLTNENKSFGVKVTKTRGVGSYDTYNDPEEDALVTIIDDLGNVTVLEDHNHGNYQTKLNSIIGQVGREYHLHIITKEGNVYETQPILMLPSPDITIHKKYEVKPSAELGQVQEGYQIYMDVNNTSSGKQFFRYVYKETWEILIRWPYPPMEKRHCWVSESNKTFILKSSENRVNNSIVDIPIKYISTDTDRLRIKYSILVSQYSVSKEEYEYWKQLGKLNQEIGTLYDPIPTEVTGNVYCCTDPDKKVIGYFSVNAVNSKRYFIDHLEHDLDIYDPYKYCPEDVPGGYILQLDPVLVSGDIGCVDCTTRGVNQKPGYWDDD